MSGIFQKGEFSFPSKRSSTHWTTRRGNIGGKGGTHTKKKKRQISSGESSVNALKKEVRQLPKKKK